MAIKITKAFVSPFLGDLTEAVVRIENYRIEKLTGLFHVTLAMFKDESDAADFKFEYIEDFLEPHLLKKQPPMVVPPAIVIDGEEKTYPTYIQIPFTTPMEVEEEVYEDMVTTEVYSDFDDDGNVVQKTRNITVSQKTGTITVTKNKIDMTMIGSDPYTWAYDKIKPYFEELFGAENITNI
jgi:hypothetical protein